MTSQPGYQTIVIYILPNISRSKRNQIMKVGQLIEYNMRDIFLDKSYTKCGVEASPRPFSGKLKLSKSLDQQPKVFTVCFYYILSCWLSKYIENKLQTTCSYLILSIYKKQKEVWNQSPQVIFCIIFEEKYFSGPNFILCLLLLREILDNMCIATVR